MCLPHKRKTKSVLYRYVFFNAKKINFFYLANHFILYWIGLSWNFFLYQKQNITL